MALEGRGVSRRFADRPTSRWYRHDYADAEQEAWAQKIRASRAKEAWAYFNNDFQGRAFRNAQTLRRLLS
ncbi:MAG: DUF72 domain-containing protein [Verrucomicrobia bacterium]|nr:DUF72 domain-containing protein [Verrucomicrobiota bacterium]